VIEQPAPSDPDLALQALQAHRLIAPGAYESIDGELRVAWRVLCVVLDAAGEAVARSAHEALRRERDAYLRSILARLPFSWHVAHAFSARETAGYGGSDYVVLRDPVRIGKSLRKPGDTLSRTGAGFRQLLEVEEGRLPTSVTDIRVAERLACGLLEIGPIGPIG